MTDENILADLDSLENDVKEYTKLFRDNKEVTKLLRKAQKLFPVARRGIEVVLTIQTIVNGVEAWRKQISK